MTRVVSIITAVHEPAVHFLSDTWNSLKDQVLPRGWTWEWLVQEDGPAGAADVLPGDPRISVDANRKGGAAITRNMALPRARGELVRVLDADDQLTPGALARDVQVLAEQSDIGWTTCRVLDLMPDGSTVGWEHSDPPRGRMSRGRTLDYFERNNFRLPVHPATLCIRHDLLLALGAWMALPLGEDTGLLLAASVVSDGYFIDQPGLLYRKWPGQTTTQISQAGSKEWTTRMRVVDQRARALLALSLGRNQRAAN